MLISFRKILFGISIFLLILSEAHAQTDSVDFFKLSDSISKIDSAVNILTISHVQSFEKIHAGNQLKFALKITLKKDWHINSNTPNEDLLIPTKITLGTKGQFFIETTVYPAPKEYNFIFSDKPVSVYGGTFYIAGIIKSAQDLKEGVYDLPLHFSYQACHDASCMAPKTAIETLKVEVVDRQTHINEINAEFFSSFDLAYLSKPLSNESDISRQLESAGLIVSLIIIFFSGLALNLTPCVYPLIPITISYFGGQSENQTSKLFVLGLLYVAGMSVTYSIIGVATALSGSVLGVLLQKPIVIILISSIFIVLSLGMFGIYNFQLPGSWVEKAGGARSGAFGALFMGLTMGIVAAPCIGPFVLGLITYVAAKGDPVYGFFMFFFLSLGLGTPYLFLALFSGKIKQLPKAGFWMEAVKHIFGLILMGMAIYFILPLLPEPIKGYALPVFGMGAGLYLLFFDKTANDILGFKIFKIGFSMLVLAISLYIIVPSDQAGPEWQVFSEIEYEQAIENGQKMIIFFHADWCIPCRELEKITFAKQRLINQLKNFNVFQVDMTHTMNKRVERIRRRFEIVGMPTIIIINSNGHQVKRISGFVSADVFIDMISEIH